MIKVEFPPPDFRMKEENSRRLIFDGLRKAWLVLTEEEWVRQCFISYLVKVLHYPSALIAVEKEILLHGMKKRFDILVYNSSMQPWMMVECKAPEVEVNEKVLNQVLIYNQTVPVDFLVITNGKSTVGWERRDGNLHLLDRMPLFLK